jgi:hypothetical protein
MKNVIAWKYERASWQWDILCLVIIAFIFLTPKEWFERRETLATRTSRLIVKAQDLPPEKSAVEQTVKELSGSENAEILAMRELKNARGETFYEIDIK